MRYKVLMLACLIVASSQSLAEVIYSEDFSSDPNYTSFAPGFVNWNATEENYRLETYRNDTEQYWSYAALPEFRSTELESISIDLYYEALNPIAYPTLRFYGDVPLESSMASNPYGIGFSNYNCCGDPNRFIVYDAIENSRTISTAHVTTGIWYNLQLDFFADQTFDVLFTERSSGNVVLQTFGLAYADTTYRYMGMGYYTPGVGGPPSTMLLDNIEITGVPVPPTLGIFLLGLAVLTLRRRGY